MIKFNFIVIVQASQGAIKYAGLNYIIALVRQAAEGTAVPVVLHLDHGTSFEQVMQCIRFGFTSVMYAGSQLLLEGNIAQTRKTRETAGEVIRWKIRLFVSARKA